ncbi:hypothetical protein [Micromonospora sp. NPDC048898]|uniref:hypothetical protein n=1 Tax=Micromonospora sp. NPDC048898 TaxID=3364260 RepID=UPI003714AEFB
MTTGGYDVEPHEVDATVRAVLDEVLTAAAEHPDLIAQYHELTRTQRLWEVVGPRIVHALVAERGAVLRATGLRQVDLIGPALLGTQQHVSKIMRAADDRDPVAVRIVSVGVWVNQLNSYQGDNIWDDLIRKIDGYDDEATAELDPSDRSDVCVIDGAVLRFDQQTGEWYGADQ